MNINVTVDGLDAIDLDSPIGGQRYEWDEEIERNVPVDMTLGERIAELIMAKLTKDELFGKARERYLKIRDEEIRAAVKPIVAGALAGTIRLTNSYGEPTGPETTLNALVIEEAKKVIGGGRTDYGRGDTLAQRVVKDAVGAALTKELNAVLADEKAKVVAAVRASAADLIADAIKKGLGR